jgi:hypothetical protein
VTDHRDPIEAWLSADVEPLPPRPGTFERVHRRARRRKVGRTISAAASVAVVVAAAAILPQVAGGLLSGSPTAPSKVGARTSATSQPAGTTIQAPRAADTTLGGHGPALLGAGTGPAAAAGFRPTSVTFVTGTLGVVLGQAGSCGTGPCTVMAGTSNHGGSWSKVGAPPAPPPGAPSGVSQISFLGPLNGWAYGPALYATHDGGRTWRRFTLRGRVIDLSAAGNRAFAVIGTNCAGSGSDYASGCARFVMYSAAARSNRWHAVAGATGAGAAAPGGLQLTSKHGYLVSSGRLYAGPVMRGAWHRVASAAPAAPPCLVPPSGRGPWLLAPSASTLYLICSSSPAAASQKLALYISRDDGRTWLARGAAPATATSLAVSPRGTLVLAATGKIYFSRDARRWQVATLTGSAPKGGFGFVGMTTGADGVAVPASPALHEIFITSDGGRTWRPSVIR